MIFLINFDRGFYNKDFKLVLFFLEKYCICNFNLYSFLLRMDVLKISFFNYFNY